jgi:hypothetical protein
MTGKQGDCWRDEGNGCGVAKSNQVISKSVISLPTLIAESLITDYFAPPLVSHFLARRYPPLHSFPLWRDTVSE